ncbi:hypothetical protein [Pseudoflavonifractor sp. An176]|uniref:hypothetical protein n=1 Tax=Pseudoflavonifractor sp. An176 TaxID=1965572 RepID=UPI00194E4657|nr:hypothetical protein [Pseudoflavonifractor sp. An176]
MPKQKNAAHGAATPERQETGTYDGATTSNIQFTTAQGAISRLLLHGQANALPRRELEALTGLDGRTVRLMIEQERRAGVPVLSDNARGYFLPETAQETVACVRSLRHRAGEILRTAAAIERTVPQELAGQLVMDNITMEVFNE